MRLGDETANVDGASTTQTPSNSNASPIGILNTQAGGMILICFGIVGCALIAWGFQRNARRKLAARDEEYESILRASAEARAAARASTPKPTTTTTPTGASVRNQAELAADVAEIATLRHDLRELGRKVVGEIDERLATLEATIVRADSIANRLEQAMQEAAPAQQSPSVIGTIPSPFVQPSPSPTHSSYIENAPLRSASPLHEPRNPRDETRAIIELSEQGVPAREIAQRLSRPIGQVELIIALRGKGAGVLR